MGMHFQGVAMRLVKPRNQDNLMAHVDTFKALRNRCIHFKPRVRRAFTGVFGGFRALFERRPQDANWGKGIVSLLHITLSFSIGHTRHARYRQHSGNAKPCRRLSCPANMRPSALHGAGRRRMRRTTAQAATSPSGPAPTARHRPRWRRAPARPGRGSADAACPAWRRCRWPRCRRHPR